MLGITLGTSDLLSDGFADGTMEKDKLELGCRVCTEDVCIVGRLVVTIVCGMSVKGTASGVAVGSSGVDANGDLVGKGTGSRVGMCVGIGTGCLVGMCVGIGTGCWVGMCVGIGTGCWVGTFVEIGIEGLSVVSAASIRDDGAAVGSVPLIMPSFPKRIEATSPKLPETVPTNSRST